mgnify:CR=1 FL=1
MTQNTNLAALLSISGLLLIIAGSALWLLLPELDLRLFDALRLHDDGGWVTAFTRLGGFATLGPVALAAVGLLLILRRNGEAVWLFATIASGRLAIEGLKLLFERARPPLAGRLDLVTSYSFPSSHSTGTMLTLLALAMLARRQAFGPLAMVVACAMGWSRIALGVHWPGDVLAGLGLGMFWVGSAMRWHPKTSPRSNCPRT